MQFNRENTALQP